MTSKRWQVSAISAFSVKICCTCVPVVLPLLPASEHRIRGGLFVSVWCPETEPAHNASIRGRAIRQYGMGNWDEMQRYPAWKQKDVSPAPDTRRCILRL